MKRIWLNDGASIQDHLNDENRSVVAAAHIETLLEAAAIADDQDRLDMFRFQTSLASLGPLGRFTFGVATKRLDTLSIVASDAMLPTLALWARYKGAILYPWHGEIKHRGFGEDVLQTSTGALEFREGELKVHGKMLGTERRVLRIEPGPSITWVFV